MAKRKGKPKAARAKRPARKGGARAREGSKRPRSKATPAKPAPAPTPPTPPAEPSQPWQGSTQAREGPIPRGSFGPMAAAIAKELTASREPRKATPEVMETFLDALAFSGSIARACVAAGIPRKTYYAWRERSETLHDLAGEIELAWVEEIKSTWVRIAAYGDAEPARDMLGKIVGERIRRYETSAMFLLERRLRKQFATENERAIAAKRQAEAQRELPAREEDRVRRIIKRMGRPAIPMLPPGLQEQAKRLADEMEAEGADLPTG